MLRSPLQRRARGLGRKSLRVGAGAEVEAAREELGRVRAMRLLVLLRSGSTDA